MYAYRNIFFLNNFLLGQRICVGCSTKLLIVLSLIAIFPSMIVLRLSTKITESHHSISGMSSDSPSDFAIKANFVADEMPVFFAI